MHEYVAATRHTLPDFSPRPAFGCRFGAVRQKLIARNFNVCLLRCMSMSRLSVIRCPIFHRALHSVVASARSGRNSLPGISPWLGGLPSVAASARSGRNSLPGISPRLAFGCRTSAAGQKLIARNFIATCIRLPLRRGRTENHCPEFHRGLPSVHEYVAATRHTLPGFSPRLAFGCRTSAAGQKLIARNFNVCLLRCMSMSRLPVIRCPIFHRDLPSVAASARSQPDANPFPLLSVACI